MAKSARRRTEPKSALPPMLDRFLQRLSLEPREIPLVLLVAGLAAALYASGLGYPLVFGDFAVLAPANLKAQLEAAPSVGSEWLATATFAWSAKLFGSAWSWHRALNLVLHACASVIALLLFRRVCVDVPAGSQSIASGWLAWFAACLFALSPAAVYAVAYLAERTQLLAGLFALLALWSTARAAQDGWRPAWLIGPLACVAALLSTPGAIGLPVAMGLLVFGLAPRQGRRRASGWGSVAIAALLALAYAFALGAAPTQPMAQPALNYADAVTAAAFRFAQYVGFWLLPATPWMAVDIAEPATQAWESWRRWSGIAAVAVAVIGGGVLMRRRNTLSARAALLLLCALALYLPELVWPRLAEPFALSRSYAWMGCLCLALPCLVATLPVRAAFATACVVILVWTVLAANRLQTFSSHAALWNDAVRRVELTGTDAADIRIYLNRAAMHRREGHLIAAIADYDKVLTLDADNRRALRGRAQALVDDKQYEAALRDLDRLLQLDPGQSSTLADRALALMQAGRLDEAGRAFDQAIESGVKEPRVYLNRALTRLKAAGIDAAGFALIDIERAIEIDPRYALAHYNRGLLFEEAAKAGIRLRDAASPEIMRAVAEQNIARACQLGHAGACARQSAKKQSDAPAPDSGPIRVTPETLRKQGLPIPK